MRVNEITQNEHSLITSASLAEEPAIDTKSNQTSELEPKPAIVNGDAYLTKTEKTDP